MTIEQLLRDVLKLNGFPEPHIVAIVEVNNALLLICNNTIYRVEETPEPVRFTVQRICQF